MDKRAEALPEEYLVKAREADRKYNGVLPWTVGGVEQKLVDLGEVRGVVAGNFGEVSEATHILLSHLATSQVRVAGVTRGRRGVFRSDEAERSLAISSLRRRLGVATVRAQAYSTMVAGMCWGQGQEQLLAGGGLPRSRRGGGDRRSRQTP